MRFVLLALTVGLAVAGSIRILNVRLVPPRQPANAAAKNPSLSRLLIAVILLAAGASLFIVLAVRWIGRTLDGILSPPG